MEKDKIAIIALTIVAAVMRFFHLTFNPLWVDEGVTQIFAQHSAVKIWAAIASGKEFNPPFFYWLEHLVIGVMGTSDFALRLIPAIAGVLTIPVVYLLGKEILDEKVGIISAALMTFSVFHIAYSQEARAYSCALLFYTLALLFFVRATKTNKNRFIDLSLFGAFATLSVWTHYYALLFLIPVFMTLIMELIVWDKKKLWVPVIVSIIAVLPMLVTITTSLSNKTSSSEGYINTMGLEAISHTIYQLGGFNLITGIILIILAIVGFRAIYKGLPTVDETFFIFHLAVAMAIIAISPIVNFVPKYLIFILPVWFILVAGSYKQFLTKKGGYFFVILVFAIVIALSFPALYNFYTIPYKIDWKGIVDFAIAFK